MTAPSKPAAPKNLGEQFRATSGQVRKDRIDARASVSAFLKNFAATAEDRVVAAMKDIEETGRTGLKSQSDILSDAHGVSYPKEIDRLHDIAMTDGYKVLAAKCEDLGISFRIMIAEGEGGNGQLVGVRLIPEMTMAQALKLYNNELVVEGKLPTTRPFDRHPRVF